MIRIGVVLGSTRPGRRGKDVADWVMRRTEGRQDAVYELIDLADHPLPHLDEPNQPSLELYTKQHSHEWSQVISRFDGFVFVTPEYNHAVPGVLKNAIDFLYTEWNDKAAGFVGYGTVGAARAVEQLRLIAAGVDMATVRAQVALSLFTDFRERTAFDPAPSAERALDTVLDRVVAWSGALKSVREASAS
ncbi:NADPH-dependent FMN reductase [Leifsonia sp. NPDC058194]|uniref:NADPH-dependent FMN reductase n=1 Tax=Leifsonia sp. NPDC058194 TaxID=3346374 RepID=UPI0036DB0813